jgi:hypothetical protein
MGPGGATATPRLTHSLARLIDGELAGHAVSGDVLQRATIATGDPTVGDKGTIDTATMSIHDLTVLAQKLFRADAHSATAAAIYRAIQDGEHLEEAQDEDDDEADAGGGAAAFDLADLADLAPDDEPDEAGVSADLLTRGEIITLHKSVAREVKGFRYDNLTIAIATAAGKATLDAKIAALVYAVVAGHTFNDGNKRTGQLMLNAMRRKNGKKALPFPDVVQEALTGAASGWNVDKFQGEIAKLNDWNPMGHAIL